MVMTGEVAIRIRRDAYKQKRVFFVTPQAGNHPLGTITFPRDIHEAEIR